MAQSGAQVGIVMGSDSDWPTMQACYDTLKEFGIGAVVKVCSAHRTPDDAGAFAKSAHEDGIGVIIAAAGMSAHLAGAMAAHSPLPIIGVPLAGPHLDGLDALLSTVDMPPGVPVATVAIGKPGAKNAALLAVQILGAGDDALRQKFIEYKQKMAEQVREKNAVLQQGLR